MIKYLTNWEGDNIQQVEIFREEDDHVVIKQKDGTERIKGKRTGWDSYHNTWKEAHEFILKKAIINVCKDRDEFQKSMLKLGSVGRLKPLDKL